LSRDRALELRVDWIACEGYGLCGDYAPGVIGLDDWRYPILPDGPLHPGDVNDVRRAIDCCPVRALRLVAAGSDRR
jgi:ferredoxin